MKTRNPSRRDFLVDSCLALFWGLLGGSRAALADPGVREVVGPFRLAGTRFKSDIVPVPEITAAVDVLVPADPDIPGDFTGSDYGADRVVAGFLGDLGQLAATAFLDRFAREVADKSFLDCTESERLEAIKVWIRERETVDPMFAEVLTGLLTLSLVGTYEGNSQAEQQTLFTAMGWFDPEDPTGTFRVPNEGYPDAHLLPVGLRLRQGDE
jgi:hypothetical protein